MGALRLVQHGIVNRDVAQDGSDLILRQPVDLEQRVRDLPRTGRRRIHRAFVDLRSLAYELCDLLIDVRAV